VVDFGPETAENGWRVFANFGTCSVVARAYSLEQQNAGRAHDELCHASSYARVSQDSVAPVRI